jgi:hypothetical protein
VVTSLTDSGIQGGGNKEFWRTREGGN